MKTLLASIAFLSLAATTLAQNIYWTGNEDRWGGGSLTATKDDNFSLTAGGNDYQKVSNGEFYHFNFVEGSMTGTTMAVSMNRASVTMLSLTITAASPVSGFTFDTVGMNSDGIALDGNLTVTAGDHLFNNSGILNELPNYITLTKNLEWNIAADARVIWKIDLVGAAGNEGLTKTGGGVLIIRGDAKLGFTGPFAVSSGSFGGRASLAGALNFAAGTQLEFGTEYTLTVAGGASFAGPFGVADINGLSNTIPAGSYTLIDGAVNFANIANVGASNAVSIGDGAIAYFQEGVSSLVLVVEGSTGPTTWADWPIFNDQGDVDTGDFLGWINVSAGDWIWNYSLSNYMYLPKSWVTPAGAWNFTLR